MAADCGGSNAAAAAGASVACSGRPAGGVLGSELVAGVVERSLPEQCEPFEGQRPSIAAADTFDSRDWQRGLVNSLKL